MTNDPQRSFYLLKKLNVSLIKGMESLETYTYCEAAK
jgi:hypothetical protein